MPSTLGPYTLVKRLAVGGMAEIFLAKKSGLVGFEKHFAIKAILPQNIGDEESEKVMMDEARLTSQLKHDNIVTVHDLGKDKGRIYQVMEYIRGQDLSRLLAALREVNGLMALEVCAYVAREMCAGLHYAHTRVGTDGKPLILIHRDISPQNVLIGIDGDVKLTDFGVAKTRGQGRIETKTGVIKGKLRYMAPEYAIGNMQDQRSDIFATGLCLYEMITGKPAYDDQTLDASELLERIKTANIPPPQAARDEIPAELSAIVQKALQPHPDDRFQTALDLQQELSIYLAHMAPGFTKAHFGTYTQRLMDKLNLAPELSGSIDSTGSKVSMNPGLVEDLDLPAEDVALEPTTQVDLSERDDDTGPLLDTGPDGEVVAQEKTGKIQLNPDLKNIPKPSDLRAAKSLAPKPRLMTASGFNRLMTPQLKDENPLAAVEQDRPRIDHTPKLPEVRVEPLDTAERAALQPEETKIEIAIPMDDLHVAIEPTEKYSMGVFATLSNELLEPLEPASDEKLDELANDEMAEAESQAEESVAPSQELAEDPLPDAPEPEAPLAASLAERSEPHVRRSPTPPPEQPQSPGIPDTSQQFRYSPAASGEFRVHVPAPEPEAPALNQTAIIVVGLFLLMTIITWIIFA